MLFDCSMKKKQIFLCRTKQDTCNPKEFVSHWHGAIKRPQVFFPLDHTHGYCEPEMKLWLIDKAKNRSSQYSFVLWKGKIAHGLEKLLKEVENIS